jgi:2-hydroxy-3-oxopropionate reductase
VTAVDRIGFIGLGVMGHPMALNLARAGFEVVGYSRTEATRSKFAAAGGIAGDNVAGVANGADVVITMLPDAPDVREVVLGESGVFESAKPGLIYIDMSTISPETAKELAKEGNRRQIRVLDAPVSGGEAGAREAALSIMVGGTVEDFKACKPVFEALGKTVIHVGSHGAGQTVKAANQLIVAGTIELVAEAIVLLQACGDVDVERAIQVMSGGLAGNRILERKASSMLAHDFEPGFRVDLHHKDLGIVLSSARSAGAVLPLTAVVAQLMAALRANGQGSQDHTALLTLVERLSGR